MKVDVIYSRWSHDGGELTGGVQEISSPSKKFLAQLGAAEAAGAVKVLEASKDERSALASSVQSQADGEKAYHAAQASGEWQLGNLQDYIVRAEDALKHDAKAEEEGTLRLLSDQTRDWLAVGLDEAQRIKKHIDENDASYDEAVTAIKAGN